MLIAVYVLGSIAVYVAMVFITNKLISNHLIMREFKPALALNTKDNYKAIKHRLPNDATEYQKILEAHQCAYSTAVYETEIDRDFAATLGAAFWPLGIVFLLVMYAIDGIAGLTKTAKPLPSKAEREIAKIERKIESDKMRLDHIDGLIKDAKSMGMSDDVIKGFEEMKKNI